MRRIEQISHETEAHWTETLTLPFALRQRTRQRVRLDSGEEAALLLERSVTLRHGDLLLCDDGTRVRVIAAPENVLFAVADDPFILMRAAYHLGNRHTPIELGRDHLKLGVDPVLREMLIRLGLRVEERELPFEPEPGAYGGGHRHGHDESFAEDYALAQKLFHDHRGMGVPAHKDRGMGVPAHEDRGMGVPAHEHGQDARDTEDMGKDAHATFPMGKNAHATLPADKDANVTHH
jgi:urease accessory protein